MDKTATGDVKGVILLTIDSLRKDVISPYGAEKNLTPFLNSIQGSCLRFTNMQATGPYTQASFPAILASAYYLEYGREKKLSSRKTLISEVLKKSGIVTAAFHSNPYLSGFFGWNRGWDTFYDSMEEEVADEIPYVRGDEINRKVESFLSSYVQEGRFKPFFLWAHYMDVHEPYVPDENYLNLVDPSLNLARDEMMTLFKNTLLKRDTGDPEKVKLLKTLYLAHVSEVDTYIKELFELLKKVKLLDDVVVLITSDHGDEFTEHGGLSHDGKMYSELINVPFMVYDPTIKRGRVLNTLVSSIDIPPTILRLFGLQPEVNFQGKPLLPLGTSPERPCFGEAVGKRGVHEKSTDKPVYYCYIGKHKLIYTEEGDEWEIYDVEADPQERHNMLGTTPGADKMKDALRPRIRRWLKE